MTRSRHSPGRNGRLPRASAWRPELRRSPTLLRSSKKPTAPSTTPSAGDKRRVIHVGMNGASEALTRTIQETSTGRFWVPRGRRSRQSAGTRNPPDGPSYERGDDRVEGAHRTTSDHRTRQSATATRRRRGSRSIDSSANWKEAGKSPTGSRSRSRRSASRPTHAWRLFTSTAPADCPKWPVRWPRRRSGAAN